jgi:hypothetical protein
MASQNKPSAASVTWNGGSGNSVAATQSSVPWPVQSTSSSAYIDQNAHIIPDYGARWRAGQVISTAFIESLVNSLLAKRFAKKQSTQWTPQGAHLLLQIRTRTLNGDLASTFRKSYPDFVLADQPVNRHLLAA